MSRVNRHSHCLMFLLADEDPAWFQEVSVYLTGYELRMAKTADEAWKSIQTKEVGVVIATPTPDSLRFFERVRSINGSLARPVLALIAADGALTHTADLLLPPTPTYFGQLLTTFMQLQTRIYQLETEKQALVDDNARLKKEFHVSKRVSDEVTLLKNAIVRNVSHELKTPLLQVKSAVALLAEDARDKRLADYATSATSRLEGVVKNISQLADSLDLSMGPVLVRETIDFAIRNLRRSWEHKDDIPRIKVDIEANLPLVHGNKQGLGTILQLLMDNALKFSTADIEVSACRFGKEVQIAVKDHGIGIAKDKFEQIFESFYQIDSSETRRYGGAGVGLAIVRLILERHDVKINVESQEGVGSTFSFLLPVADIRAGAWKQR